MMADFTTPVSIPPAPFQIGYETPLFFMGSCFAENMGRRMKEYKFRVCLNPYGVIYNPLSIAEGLELLLEKDGFTAEDLSFYNELWFSFRHYTLFSDVDKAGCLAKINERFREAKEFIAGADVLILTLGTSRVFRFRETGRIVSNCHKIPASQFERFFASSEQSAEALIRAILKIRRINPRLKVILSVSPIRHWKDGAIENQRSKAALILAVAKIQSELTDVYYFPAYEIVMDELRDYRFYAADRFHPSEEAQEYLWERFSSVFLTEGAMTILKSVQSITTSVKHKPRFTHTQSYREFLNKTIKEAGELRNKFPFLDFTDELEKLKIV